MIQRAKKIPSLRKMNQKICKKSNFGVFSNVPKPYPPDLLQRKKGHDGYEGLSVDVNDPDVA